MERESNVLSERCWLWWIAMYVDGEVHVGAHDVPMRGPRNDHVSSPTLLTLCTTSRLYLPVRSICTRSPPLFFRLSNGNSRAPLCFALRKREDAAAEYRSR